MKRLYVNIKGLLPEKRTRANFTDIFFYIEMNVQMNCQFPRFGSSERTITAEKHTIFVNIDVCLQIQIICEKCIARWKRTSSVRRIRSSTMSMKASRMQIEVFLRISNERAIRFVAGNVVIIMSRNHVINQTAFAGFHNKIASFLGAVNFCFIFR